MYIYIYIYTYPCCPQRLLPMHCTQIILGFFSWGGLVPMLYIQVCRVTYISEMYIRYGVCVHVWKGHIEYPRV